MRDTKLHISPLGLRLCQFYFVKCIDKQLLSTILFSKIKFSKFEQPPASLYPPGSELYRFQNSDGNHRNLKLTNFK